MRFRTRLLAVTAAALGLVAVFTAAPARAYTPTPGTIYQLPASQPCLKGRGNCAIYPKAAQLPDGRLVASFEQSTVPASGSAAGQTLPVYSSDDNGSTWQLLSQVQAPAYLSSNPAYAQYVSAWTNPYLYVLPQAVGSLRAGTLLMAAVVSGNDYYYLERKAANPNWVPTSDGDRSNMAIALYSSTTNGASWNFLNIVTAGGWEGGSAGAIGVDVSTANSGGQVDPVWEPYLMVYDGELVAYYSDEGGYLGYNSQTGVLEPGPVHNTATGFYGQVIAHRTWNGTSASWSSPVADATGETVSIGNGEDEIGGGQARHGQRRPDDRRQVDDDLRVLGRRRQRPVQASLQPAGLLVGRRYHRRRDQHAARHRGLAVAVAGRKPRPRATARRPAPVQRGRRRQRLDEPQRQQHRDVD